MVGALEPTFLDEAIQKAMKYEENWPRDKPKKSTSSSKPPHKEEKDKKGEITRTCPWCKGKRGKDHWCKRMEELKRKGLCFRCQQPWGQDHRCSGKSHQLKAYPNDEYPNKKARFEGESQAILATISQASKHSPFHIKSTLNGQKVITLVDSGASHSFIDQRIVNQRKLRTMNFEGFEATTATGARVQCTTIVPQLEVLLGDHLIIEDFYVVPLDADIILGTPWIYYSLCCFMFDLPNQKICFQHKGQEVTLKGLPDGSPKVVSRKRMERIFRRGQGEWAAQCMILDKSTTHGKAIHIEIQPIIKKYGKVFKEIPPRLPPTRGFEHTIELEKKGQNRS